MKKLLIALTCLAAVATGSAMAQDNQKIRIAFDVPYEPFEYRTPEGELTGFEVELAQAVCDELKADCEFVVQAWDGIIPGLMARKYDAIMSSMSITEERKQMVLFSEPYYNTPSNWFAREGTDIQEISKQALEGKVIGVQRGTTQDAYVTDNFSSVADINRYNTADDMVLDLEGERLDLVFLDFPVGDEVLMKEGGYVVIGEEVKLGQGMGVAFRKRDEELAEKFNKALEKLKNDGTYDKIMEKYFDYSIKV